jgi:hypothetical protein
MKRSEISLKSSDLAQKILELNDKIEKFANIKEWQIHEKTQIITGEKTVSSLRVSMEEDIKKLSLNRKKILRKYIHRLMTNMTLKSVNLFYHFLATKVTKRGDRIKYLISRREIEINIARNKWKETNKKQLELLEKYKKIKGDYYKEKT